MGERRRTLSLPGAAVLISLIAAIGIPTDSASAAKPVRATAAKSSPCADPYPARRDPNNPLMLPRAPGSSNPLRGASLFVDGPSHGAAAGQIARLLGIGSNYPPGHYLPEFSDSESWVSFVPELNRLLRSRPAVAAKVRDLQKIASEPESQRISNFSEGGGPGAIADFTRKLFCHNFTADPGAVPVITTYFLHPALGGCATSGQINAYMPTFHRRVSEMVSATANRPVVYLLELDAIGSSYCMYTHGSLPAWEAALRYEINQVSSLPHAVVYVEGGYSDSDTAKYNAMVLNAIGIGKIQGFFTNDTHINWTIDEVNFANKISALTHGTHFIVNTAQNGNGPKLNPHPGRQGIEDLCNPPGRGLGPQPTTQTGDANVNAYLWTHIPGNSSGSCNGGPASGTFWPARAEDLAAHANNRIGPSPKYPSRPY
jgi:endoglucanase